MTAKSEDLADERKNEKNLDADSDVAFVRDKYTQAERRADQRHLEKQSGHAKAATTAPPVPNLSRNVRFI